MPIADPLSLHAPHDKARLIIDSTLGDGPSMVLRPSYPNGRCTTRVARFDVTPYSSVRHRVVTRLDRAETLGKWPNAAQWYVRSAKLRVLIRVSKLNVKPWKNLTTCLLLHTLSFNTQCPWWVRGSLHIRRS